MRALWPLAVLSLLACSSAPTQLASVVREVGESDVVGCQELGFVTGVSGRMCVSKESCDASAKEKAREAAARLGATHIIYTDVLEVTMSEAANVRGQAFRCTAPRS